MTYLFRVTAEILSSIALLVAHRAVIDDSSGVRVHVLFILKQFIGLVLAFSTSVLVDAMMIVHAGHHPVVFEEALAAHLAPVGILLEMGRLAVILQTGLGAQYLATLVTTKLARLGLLLMNRLNVSFEHILVFQ